LVLLVVANASYLNGERYLMFNYDLLNTMSPAVDYRCVAAKNDVPAWTDCSQLSTRRRRHTSRSTPASQRKRRPDRLLIHFTGRQHCYEDYGRGVRVSVCVSVTPAILSK